MAVNQKLVALLVLCALLAGVEARATVDSESFKVCYLSCHDTCKSEGHGIKYCYPMCKDVCKDEHFAKVESQKH